MDTNVRPVLVVDDNPLNRLLLVRMLQALGIPADEADSGHEAMRMIDQRRYEAIFADIQMPEITGIDVAFHAKRKALNSPPPKVVAVSGLDQGDASRFGDLRVFDFYLRKPVFMQNLKTIVLTVLTKTL